MNLFHLKHVPWLESQLIYHAQARLDVECIDILAPREPYVSIGYHQDAKQEVDLAYCREHGIPVVRREVGGGAVYLDGNQVFYQIVLHRDDPLTQGDKASFYQRMLQPVVEAYRDLGVPCRYRPINDIVTEEGRKISGNGAATIGDCVVLVGNLIADFDYEMMSRVLRVPDEKYRDKVFKSLQENLTTLKRESGRMPEWKEMTAPLIQRFEQVLGPLVSKAVPQAVRDEMDRLRPVFESEEWLHKKGSRQAGRDVKITGGINVVQRVHKAPGGLIRATVELREDHLYGVSLSGDYFSYPEDGVDELESVLEGAEIGKVEDRLVEFYSTGRVETPGVTVRDWMMVLSM